VQSRIGNKIRSEEEEGTGIASDVVKVEDAESGHPRSPDLRNDTGTAISPMSGQQNKATRNVKVNGEDPATPGPGPL